MTMEDYFFIRSMYVYKMGITPHELYRKTGELIRSGKESEIPPFEQENPFVTPEDILKIKMSQEQDASEKYAKSIERAIRQYQRERKIEQGFTKVQRAV